VAAAVVDHLWAQKSVYREYQKFPAGAWSSLQKLSMSSFERVQKVVESVNTLAAFRWGWELQKSD